FNAQLPFQDFLRVAVATAVSNNDEHCGIDLDSVLATTLGIAEYWSDLVDRISKQTNDAHKQQAVLSLANWVGYALTSCQMDFCESASPLLIRRFLRRFEHACQHPTVSIDVNWTGEMTLLEHCYMIAENILKNEHPDLPDAANSDFDFAVATAANGR